jgi:hypothetical protein
MAKITGTNNSNPTGSDRRKAAAYINLGVLNKDKSQSKNLGGVPLYADNEFHAHLLAFIAEHGAENLSFDCTVNIVADPSDFEL